jgi:hypothetical protein
MRGFVRIALTAGALGLTLVLAGCENFDPTAIFDSDLFNTKKPLPGQRRPVFPEGTPGITQGVPPDMVKGYQAPAEDPAAPQTTATAAPKQAAVEEPSESKPKPKPKPKQVAKPPEHPTQTAGAAAEQPAAQSPAAPVADRWPSSSEARGGVAWPDPPSAR